MTVPSFTIVSAAGVNMGTLDAAGPREALDLLARDAGYQDHRYACETTGDDPDEWTCRTEGDRLVIRLPHRGRP